MRAMIGKPLVFGVAEPLPLFGFPIGKTRIKMRPDDWVKIFIKTDSGIEEWVPEKKDGNWTPGVKISQNIRPT